MTASTASTQSIQSTQTTQLHHATALGGVFLALFGAAWLVGGSCLYFGVNLPLLAGIVAGGVLISLWAISIFRARRKTYTGTPDVEARKRIRKTLMMVNIAQWSMVGVVVLLMNIIGHPEWIMPGVIFVVGIHFLPLAGVMRIRLYYATAIGLVLAALAGFLVVSDAGRALCLAATGLILWASAVTLLKRM